MYNMSIPQQKYDFMWLICLFRALGKKYQKNEQWYPEKATANSSDSEKKRWGKMRKLHEEGFLFL